MFVNLDKLAHLGNKGISTKQILVKSELVDHLNKEKYFPLAQIRTGGKLEVSKQQRDYNETIDYLKKFTSRLTKEKQRRRDIEKEIALIRINIENV